MLVLIVEDKPLAQTALGNILSARSVFDGLGRAVYCFLSGTSCRVYSTSTDPNASGGLRYSGVTYNNLGQVLYSLTPYFTSSDQTYGYTTYQYDALGRTIDIAIPSVNNIGFTYTNRAVEETDFPDTAYRAVTGGTVPSGENAEASDDTARLQHLAQWVRHSGVG